MKTVIYAAILLISLFSEGISTITKLNRYVEEAAIAYKKQDFITAIAIYTHILYDMQVQDDQMQLNLAHSYFMAKQYAQAQQEYQFLADHPSPHIRALVHLQLGNIAGSEKKYKHALALYKEALIANPLNETARYNYELLKKYLELHPEHIEPAPQPDAEKPEQENTQAPPPPSDELEPQPKQKPDEKGSEQEEIETPSPDPSGVEEKKNEKSLNQNQRDKQQEQKSGNKPGDTQGRNPDNEAMPQQPASPANTEEITEQDQQAQTRNLRLRQQNLSPDKAKLLLDAMRNAEQQYIQQLPKKSTRKPDPKKPEW